jgi:hypothetical protein
MAPLACLLDRQLAMGAEKSDRLNQTIEIPGDISLEERQEMLDLSPLQQNSPLSQFGSRNSPTASKDVLVAS